MHRIKGGSGVKGRGAVCVETRDGLPAARIKADRGHRPTILVRPALARILVVCAGIVSGATFAQAPEFVQQYRQRLGGAVDELAQFVRDFDADAARAGLTRKEALAEYRGTRFLDLRGMSVTAVMARYERLRAQQAALREAGPFTRLAETLWRMDGDIAAAALSEFRPAVPLTLEGAGHAAAGFAAGALGAGLLMRLFHAGRARRGQARGA